MILRVLLILLNLSIARDIHWWEPGTKKQSYTTWEPEKLSFMAFWSFQTIMQKIFEKLLKNYVHAILESVSYSIQGLFYNTS